MRVRVRVRESESELNTSEKWKNRLTLLEASLSLGRYGKRN